MWIGLAPLAAVAARRPPLAPTALTALCVWGADLLSLALKAAVGRPRPFEALPAFEPLIGGTVGASLPSGHAATSFAGAVVLASLFRRWLPFLVLLAAAVSFSRVYVGAHYPSDVLAGAALGAAFALTVLAVFARRRRTAGARRRSGGAPPAG